MLDQLTLIAKYVKNLSLADKNCGISSDLFWDEMRPKEKALVRFMKDPPIRPWIEIMSDMRHRAAHSLIPMPAEVLTETEESQKTEDEILENLKKENPGCALPAVYTLVYYHGEQTPYQ